MVLTARRQEHAGKTISLLMLVLVVVIVLLLGFHLRSRWRHERVNAVLLAELQHKPLQAPAADRKAGDWPQWRGPRRDGISTETGLLNKWPEKGPKVLWRMPGGLGYSAVSISKGRACTLLQDGDNEALVCWNAADGKELWRFRYSCRYENDYGSGPRATPTIDEDRVYTVGGTGIFHCVNAQTGEKIWRHDLLEEFEADNLRWGVSFSPLVEGDLVLTNPGGASGNSLAAFDKRTGLLVWKALDDQAGYSSPLAVTLGGQRQVLFFTALGMVGVSPTDGKLLWRYPWETSFDCNIATPICVGEYVFLSSGYEQGCCLLKVVARGDGTHEAQRVYENKDMCNHFNSCVFHQDHLYGFNESTLTCLGFRTGKVVWEEKGFRKGSLLAAGEKFIVLGEQGKLALARATPAGYQEISSFQALRGKCWTVPSLADGRLYLRNEEEVLCLDLKAGGGR